MSGLLGEVFGTSFEGEITMHATTSRGTAEDITFDAKGNKIRFDAPSQRGEQSHVIFESGSKKILVVMDTQKSYMEMDLTAMQNMAVGMGHAPNQPSVPSAQATVTKTGKHEKIAGYDCEDWDIKEQNGKKAQACIAEGIPFLDFASLSPMQAPQNNWMTELHDKRLFPLKVVEYDPAGKEMSRMEVTKIEKKKLDDSVFAIPAGYKKIEIPTFGRPGLPPSVPGLAPPPHK